MQAKKIIEKLENTKGSFWQWLLAIFAFCFLRRLLGLMLESDHFETLVPANMIRNYILWYVGLFLAIALILHFITKERIERATKAAFVFWPLILLVPIIDFFFSGGKGYTLTYIGKCRFWQEFFSFFGYLGSHHITYGQTIVLMLGLLLILAYAFIKTSSIKRMFAAGLLYYLVGYFFASLPVFFLSELFSFSMFALVLAEAAIWHACLDLKKLKELIKNFHCLRSAHYLGLLLAGAVIFTVYFPGHSINTQTLLFAVFASFFAFQGALVLNNLYDKKRIDYDSNTYKSLGVLFFLLGITSALFVNTTFFLIILSAILLSITYSVPPIRFKRFGYWNNSLIGLESALMFAAGFTSQNPDIKLMPLNVFLMVLVVFSIASNIKDLKDLKQDKKEGIRTIPVIFGKKKGVKILALLSSLCFPLSTAMLGLWQLFIVSIVFGTLNGILLLKFKTEKTVFACYFTFLLALGYWLLNSF